MDGLTTGRIVHYILTDSDAGQINRRRKDAQEIHERMAVGKWSPGAQAHVGGIAYLGDYVPAIITRVWSPEGDVNLKCLLDGNDDLWVQSVQADAFDEATQRRKGVYGTWAWIAKA